MKITLAALRKDYDRLAALRKPAKEAVWIDWLDKKLRLLEGQILEMEKEQRERKKTRKR